MLDRGNSFAPGFYGTNVNATTEAVFATLSTPYAKCYSSHGFRLVADGGHKEGSHRYVVAGVGEWWPLVFRGYVDTTLDVGIAMLKLPIETGEITDVD